MRTIRIFDITMRASEQSPGAMIPVQRKMQLAQQLEKLQPDTLEAGFPAASARDLVAVKEIARRVHGIRVAAYARANIHDVTIAAEALREAEQPVIHIAQSLAEDVLTQQSLGYEEALQKIRMAIRTARSHGMTVEFTLIDAMQTSESACFQGIEVACQAGASTVTLSDTSGRALPMEVARRFMVIAEAMRFRWSDCQLGAHFQNDLGLATANSLEAIRAGATQVQVTVNGIGERAGHASLEEVATILRARPDLFGCVTGVNMQQLMATSQMVSQCTGVMVQPHKAVVGTYAWAAEVHTEHLFPVGQPLGRHAFAAYLRRLGYQLTAEHFQMAYERFTPMLREKKSLTRSDLIFIVESTTETPAAV